MAISSPPGSAAIRAASLAALFLTMLLTLSACALGHGSTAAGWLSPGGASDNGSAGNSADNGAAAEAGNEADGDAEDDTEAADPEPPFLLGDPQASQLIVLIGDSISTGFQTSIADSWPNVLVQEQADEGSPVRLRNAAENGAGYLVPGEYGRDFGEQASSALSPDASVVLVYGSENDIGMDLSDIPEQMKQIAEEVSQRAPAVKLVFVGPASYSEDVDPELQAVRDEIAQGAQNLDALFLDPIEEGWIMGREDELIGPDGTHPSVAGHQYLAKKFEALLEPLLQTQVAV
ncbi:SGNH/GDSL hydrolase family protein [Acaricomes phytoseiuli]|uniref:SGNH/GDSL hydrolase family protein n=1 Tax=Acaricomes phytoseiuli TaxID=291968 RepID=UPI00035EC769|nr:SGNH/GDSL hydrolase family protein [Acaricomes phytoseiuli]MCW1249306.1 SGNH/GDSL hydrolase family protein [Acaricomes phytoseiuli]